MTVKDLKILVCDDSIFARKKIKEYFLEKGIPEVLEASDGLEAVDKYKQYNPNIVFMDIIMPKLAGIEAVKQILEYDSKAKVVMASSVGTQEYLKNAINAGAYEFLQKPIEKELLYKIIDNLLREEK